MCGGFATKVLRYTHSSQDFQLQHTFHTVIEITGNDSYVLLSMMNSGKAEEQAATKIIMIKSKNNLLSGLRS